MCLTPRVCCTNTQGLRPDSVVLMGKNTMMKRSIKEHCKRTGNEDWMNLAELLVGNVGVIFTTVRCRRCSCFA